MTKNDMINRIEKMLGSYGVNIEAGEEDISDFIDIAVDKIEPYINDTEYITKVASSVIDLSSDNVEDVVKIYPNRSMQSSRENLDLFRFRDYSNMQDRLTLPYRISQVEDYINRSFKFDKKEKKLYLDDYIGEITIEVIKDINSIEDMQDSEDINWILDYALALTKESLGRVRGKFEVQGSPYTTDGRELAQEGKDERRELEQKLEQRGFYYITR